MDTTDVRIAWEQLESAVALALIAALNTELTARYPEDGTVNHFRLDADEVVPGRGVFLVAYVGSHAVGCGAVRLLGDGMAEIKRMYTDPAHRGRGIGRALLLTLEAEARALGSRRLVLETGPRQPEALALYARHGFESTGPFGEYEDHPLSIFLAKTLVATSEQPPGLRSHPRSYGPPAVVIRRTHRAVGTTPPSMRPRG